MSKITSLKIYRSFEIIKDGKKERMVKREKRLPPFENTKARCLGCGEDILVAVGQLMFSHRPCRAKAKKIRKLLEVRTNRHL